MLPICNYFFLLVEMMKCVVVVQEKKHLIFQRQRRVLFLIQGGIMEDLLECLQDIIQAGTSTVCPHSLSPKPREHGAELQLISCSERQDTSAQAKCASVIHIVSLDSKQSWNLLAHYCVLHCQKFLSKLERPFSICDLPG